MNPIYGLIGNRIYPIYPGPDGCYDLSGHTFTAYQVPFSFALSLVGATAKFMAAPASSPPLPAPTQTFVPVQVVANPTITTNGGAGRMYYDTTGDYILYFKGLPADALGGMLTSQTPAQGPTPVNIRASEDKPGLWEVHRPDGWKPHEWTSLDCGNFSLALSDGGGQNTPPQDPDQNMPTPPAGLTEAVTVTPAQVDAQDGLLVFAAPDVPQNYNSQADQISYVWNVNGTTTNLYVIGGMTAQSPGDIRISSDGRIWVYPPAKNDGGFLQVVYKPGQVQGGGG